MEEIKNMDLAIYAQAYTKLLYIQQNLKAPKSRRASFGNRGYNYRSCEDILNAAKPLLSDTKLILTLSDEIVIIGEASYVKAKAIVFDAEGTGTISTTAYAQIATDKKGMDVAQMTGSASSYARKYALNGLFAIDDSEDIDSIDHTEKTTKATTKAEPKEDAKDEAKTGIISEAQAKRMYAISGGDADLCKKIIAKYGYKSSKEVKWEDYEAICDEVVEERAKKEE